MTKKQTQVKKAVKKAIQRSDIEIALGRKMHQVGKEQEIFTASQNRLNRLQQEANVLDEKLKKLDG